MKRREIRTEKAERERDNLLARIHRDGGDYINVHGLDKALKDADAIVARLYAERDELREEIETWQSFFASCRTKECEALIIVLHHIRKNKITNGIAKQIRDIEDERILTELAEEAQKYDKNRARKR
jgi:hypothetical protein